MQIAVRANVRTAKEARNSLDSGFNVAFRGGLVLGFTLVGLALLVLVLLIMGYKSHFADELYNAKGVAQPNAWLRLFE